jgi:DNA-binding transcriptional ArsR family regulator
MTKKDAEKLVRHPNRVQIIALLANRKMSPNQIADQLGITLGTAAYHVRTMEKMGAIRLVNEKRVRGAIEHFYMMRKPAREPIKAALINMSNERTEAEQALSSF